MKKTEVNIEKFDFEGFEKEPSPYTVIPTNVIQELAPRHQTAYCLWSYLQSLPPDWEPNKHHLIKLFSISERTYHTHMKILVQCNLIQYVRYRYKNGRLGKVIIKVLNGSKFELPEQSNHTAKICIVDAPHCKITTLQNDHSVEKLRTYKTNKLLTKEKENKQNKQDPVFVFSDSCSVKQHIEQLIADRGLTIDPSLTNQGIYYAFTTNPDKTYKSVHKRVNIFLKKVRDNKWETPSGFKGVTSKTIREKEEQDRPQKIKQYQEEAKAFKKITQKLATSSPQRDLTDSSTQVPPLKKTLSEATRSNLKAMKEVLGMCYI